MYPSPAFKNYQLTVNCVSFIAPWFPLFPGIFWGKSQTLYYSIHTYYLKRPFRILNHMVNGKRQRKQRNLTKSIQCDCELVRGLCKKTGWRHCRTIYTLPTLRQLLGTHLVMSLQFVYSINQLRSKFSVFCVLLHFSKTITMTKNIWTEE